MSTYRILISKVRSLPNGEVKTRLQQQAKEIWGWSPGFRDEKAGELLPVADAALAAARKGAS